MSDVEIRPFASCDEDAVVRIWTDCGLVVPWNDPRRDIQRKLAVQSEMFLVACVDDEVVVKLGEETKTISVISIRYEKQD